MTLLPKWQEHTGHAKREPLEQPKAPEPFVQSWLHQATAGRDPTTVKVLDIGCGRGDRVAWLWREGFDAYGTDIEEDYLANGRRFFTNLGDTANRLRLMPDDLTVPFPPATFDVVLSNEVVEHVVNIDHFASNLATVSVGGGKSLHSFPPRRAPIEPHVHTPFVHWLPAGPARRHALELLVRLGLSSRNFRTLPVASQVSIMDNFLRDYTHYRPLQQVIQAFERQGLECRRERAIVWKTAQRGVNVPSAIQLPVHLFYETFRAVYLSTRQREKAA